MKKRKVRLGWAVLDGITVALFWYSTLVLGFLAGSGECPLWGTLANLIAAIAVTSLIHRGHTLQGALKETASLWRLSVNELSAEIARQMAEASRWRLAYHALVPRWGSHFQRDTKKEEKH